MGWLPHGSDFDPRRLWGPDDGADDLAGGSISFDHDPETHDYQR